MRFLSNLFPWPRHPQGPVSLRRALRGEMRECLRQILSTSQHHADESQVVSFLENARARRLDLSQLTVAEQEGIVVWSALPLVFPGRTAMYLGAPVRPPQLQPAQMVIQHFLDQHRGQGIRLAQAMIDPDDTAARGFYEACGFCRLAELIYLEARTKELDIAMPPDCQLLTYSEGLHEEFAAAINASYEQSLDCPGLDGVRSTEEVIAGHKGAGLFNERYWYLLRKAGRPAGVLLLSPTPPSDAMELVYIGLAVTARRCGVADALMRLAFTTARQAGCHRLTTAVDADNRPALRMYERHGMSRMGSRMAMLRVLEKASTTYPQMPCR